MNKPGKQKQISKRTLTLPPVAQIRSVEMSSVAEGGIVGVEYKIQEVQED